MQNFDLRRAIIYAVLLKVLKYLTDVCLVPLLVIIKCKFYSLNPTSVPFSHFHL